MKKALPIVMLCVIFILSFNIQKVFAMDYEQIDFYYDNKIFSYSLVNNIKTSSQFDVNFEINKYKRFSSKQERIKLLTKLIKAGIEQEVAINYLFPNLNKTITKIEKAINTKPQNAKLKIDSSSEKVFHITKEKEGKYVDKQKLYGEICNSYLNGKDLYFNVPICKVQPEIYSSQLKKFSHKRSDFSTDISSSSADRKHNVKNAIYALNKVEIMPNEVFSFNKKIGRRTQENGYRNAKIIVNNEFVDGVGGGVCQVSSTLYNSALLAGLEIVEANKHSKQVGYVKYGFDAMVNFGSSDLKFRNNTNQKLTIISNYETNKIRIRIYGEDLNNVEYKLKNEIIKVEQPLEEVVLDIEGKYQDKVMFEDESFQLKKPSRGMEIKSYREKYVNGLLVYKQLLRYDKFKVQNGVTVFGVKPRGTNLDIMLDCVV